MNKLRITTAMMAAGMAFNTLAPVYAEEGQVVLETESTQEISTDIITETPPENTPEIPQETVPDTSSEIPQETAPETPPETIPETPPENTSETPQDTNSEIPSETIPEEQQDNNLEVPQESTQETLSGSTPESNSVVVPESTQESEDTAGSEAAKENTEWTNHIDYGKYFGHTKDVRKGFARIDKEYAYAKVDTTLNIREGTSTSSRIVGKLSSKALCYVIADGDKDWVYIESGDVRGFVKSTYLQQGKKALKYVTKRGEENLKTAGLLIQPENNNAFDYTKDTVYDVKNGTGEGIIRFADQFVGNPYVWGGDSLTNGIDCSHFVYQILSRCGAYDGEYTTSYGWRSLGEEVKSLEEAKAGDVVCYEGHVALYDGHGGIVEAKGEKWGITHDRSVDCSEILTIRRFITEAEDEGSNAEIIRDYLLDNGFSKAGTAGIMANIANESYPAFESSSLEIKSINQTGISSEQYTEMVDSGAISREEVITSTRFGLYSGGRYGYGLCGFTDPTIKDYLYHYTVEQGKSIGSVSGQLDSLIAYLSDYKPDLLSRLKKADDPKTAASQFLREYENCANIDQEEAERTAAAEDIYNAMK